MEEQYNNLIRNFKKLAVDDKKEEIIDDFNVPLGILTHYTDDNSYYDLLFSYIMSLREESAKLIEKIEER